MLFNPTLAQGCVASIFNVTNAKKPAIETSLPAIPVKAFCIALAHLRAAAS